MSAHFTARAARQANRVLARTTSTGWRPLKLTQRAPRLNNHGKLAMTTRSFSSTVHWRAGLMPDAEEPQPPARVEENRVLQPTPLEDEEYHARADEYMDSIHEKAEEIQEGREDVEVEYSVSFLQPFQYQSFTDRTIRPAFSRSTCHQLARTSSTSNPRTSRSGYPHRPPARNDTTGW